MSFLSSHRLHWGEHDALTGHFFTHLEMHVHDLPPRPATPATPSHAPGDMPTIATPESRAPDADDLLPDVPGP